jgi:hypothetical protein
LDCKGHDIQHLNVRRADGRSKRTLCCGNCFHCVGFGFLGGVDSDFWLLAVATYYCPDGGFLAFSIREPEIAECSKNARICNILFEIFHILMIFHKKILFHIRVHC